MVVQHLESRLALSSVNMNEQMHEFQIVHALITQCRKQASADVENLGNNNNNHNGCENQQPVESNLGKKKGNSPKEERSSFVRTISRTFNALAQATNPSLCAKQNISSHPVSIASTVKNIISQFSRQSYHASSVCLASPCAAASSAKVGHNPHNSSVRKKTTNNKTNGITNLPSLAQSKTSPRSVLPSTSKCPVLDSKTVKTTLKSESVASLKGTNVNTVATKPKLRSVRARNAHRLTRHESAPIPPPVENESLLKKSVSVRRSKSDAVCYTSYMKQTRRKIDSNVQTKVLHFENCCKGKGQASMCVECLKHNLEQRLTTPPRNSSTLPKIDSVRPKQENYIGALSYHRPSTITPTQNVSPLKDIVKLTSLPHISVCKPTTKTPPPTVARRKAIACPGGTYFPSTKIPTLPTVSNFTPSVQTLTPIFKTPSTTNGPSNKRVETEPSPEATIATNEIQCSQTKRKHSYSEDEPMQSKRESRDDGKGNAVCASPSCDTEPKIELHDTARTLDNVMQEPVAKMDTELREDVVSNMDTEPSQSVFEGACGGVDAQIASESDNLYSTLCNNNIPQNMSENSQELPDVSLSNSSSQNEDLTLSLNYDSSDNIDSSSSSSESCLSPRQEYLTTQHSGRTVRRTPSSRYQRMRRKLKKLITRSKSCPEVVVQPLVQTQSELERDYLESMRIPTPGFMLEKSGSFSARRQQLSLHFNQNLDWMSRLPDHVLVQIFSHMDTRSLSMLKCVCKDYQFIIDSYDIRGTDSLWVKDERYIEDPCRFCRKRFTSGDVSMCRFHAKSYHCDLPYGRSYWMCCFQIERSAPGCRTGIHDNHWGALPSRPPKGDPGLRE